MSQRVIAGPPVSMQAWIAVVDWSCAATLALVTVKRKTAVPAAASKRNIVVPPFERPLPDLRRLSAGRYLGPGPISNGDAMFSRPKPDYYCVSCPLTPHVSDSR